MMSARWFAAGFICTFLAAVPAWAEGVPLREATKAQQKSAQKKFDHGKRLFDAGQFDQALKAFKDAHAVVKSAGTSLMIARTQQNLGDLLAAREHYRAALAEAEAGSAHDSQQGDTAKIAQTELDELEGILAKLTIKLIHAPEGTRVSIDDAAIDPAALQEPLILPPGQVTVVATAPDGTEVSRQVSLNAGQSTSVDLPFLQKDGAGFASAEPSPDIEPDASTDTRVESSTSGGSHTLAYIAGGVGIAGLAAFGVFGVMSNSKFDSLEDACAEDRCPASRREDADAGKRYQTFANIGLVVGAVGIGTAAALLLFGSSSEPDRDRAASRPELFVGLGSVHVSGRF
jgi:hypothetical protein